MDISILQKARYEYVPKLAPALAADITKIGLELGEATESISDREALKEIFKNTYGKPIAKFVKGNPSSSITRELRVGVILSGGQAPGGHNVIAGIFDGLKKANPSSRLFGFLGGPKGLINNKTKELTGEIIDKFRNTGGFDIIGSGRDKIEKPQEFEAALNTANELKLDAIVIIGGDDSNTNAALLAEYFLDKGSKVQVIGCPKTIDGDLKNDYIETSFGFDTACKTYSELIGNLQIDANSAKKYWHFIRLMGRSASHIALECALQCQPNICFISEEVEAKAMSLSDIAEVICSSIIKRADNGENFGVILIPEGLVEFVPEMKKLIRELNDVMSDKEEEFGALHSLAEQLKWLDGEISGESHKLISSLPADIARQFLMDRDPHGNVMVSQIETEKLLIGLVAKRLSEYKEEGIYKGKFASLAHFFGYEGRCAFPTNFDSDYCYTLGFGAFALIAHGLTSYISSVRNLSAPASEWIAGGVPLTMMMNLEQRHGSKKPVIKKALVDLDGAPFKTFKEERKAWGERVMFHCPGAIQYFGPVEVCDQPTMTLKLEHGKTRK